MFFARRREKYLSWFCRQAIAQRTFPGKCGSTETCGVPVELNCGAALPVALPSCQVFQIPFHDPGPKGRRSDSKPDGPSEGTRPAATVKASASETRSTVRGKPFEFLEGQKARTTPNAAQCFGVVPGYGQTSSPPLPRPPRPGPPQVWSEVCARRGSF